MRKAKSTYWNFSLQARYSRLPLSQKIIIPFLSIILIMGMIATVTIGYWFANHLEQQMYSEVEGFSSLVLRDFNREEQRLRWQTKLVANNPEIIQAVGEVNSRNLLQTLLPIKTTLELDLIKVLDKNGQILTNLRADSLAESILKDQAAITQALNDVYLSTLIDVQGIKTEHAQSLLVAVSPIKSEQGIIGGILIGTLIKDDLLHKITSGTRQLLVATNENKQIIATTLPESLLTTWIPSSSAQTKLVKIAEQEYFAKSAILPGLTNTSLNLISLNPVAPLRQAKHSLWIRLWSFFLAGGAIATIVGIQIARAIASPIQAVTTVARQATKEANFTLQAPVITKDEVGVLAQSLNSLIRMVAEYTQKLELARYNLERRVEERTLELVKKNQLLLNAHAQLTQTIHNLQEAQAQLIQTEKMSSLGQMVAGIAHEINNPVNFINGNIDYTQDYTQDLLELLHLYQQEFPNPTPVIQERLEEIDFEFIANDLPKLLSSMKMGAHRISQIVLSLRNFSRLDHSEMKRVNIHEGIDSTLVILSHKIKQGIEINKDYAPLPPVECYPAQLNQVFMNIISNGIDALNTNTQASTKRITIKTEIDQLIQQVTVRIRDNGPGIPADIKAKIFDPFFTTKPIGTGTGLGLSISYQIIQKHQAHIEVNSEVGQGTEFVIILPVKQTNTISTANGHKQLSLDVPVA